LKLRSLALLVVFLPQLAVATFQQPDPPKGRIEGTVLRTGTNEPITGIRVTLTRGNQPTGAALGGGTIISFAASAAGVPNAPLSTIPPTPARGAATAPPPPPSPPTPPAIPSVITDREGKFVIPDLEAGSYRLTVTGSGYVRQEYGQRVFPGQGTLLTLTQGQVMKDIVMKLTLTGNVSGRLRDMSGEPAVGVPIQLLKASYSLQGQKTFQSAGSTRTNDRGEYRLYWVTPGRYFLAAGSTAGPSGAGPFTAGGPPVSPNDPNENYVFSYFPGVTDIGAANSVDVTSGNEAAADFLVAKQQSYQIRGRVVDATTNQPPASINVSLSYSTITGGGGTFNMNTPYTPATGVFEIRDVVPGAYTLQVGSQGTVARVPLNVTNNIDGLAVVLSGTFSVAGRITIDGKLDSTGVERVRPQLRSANGFTQSPGTTAIAADGTFRFDNVAAGEYRVGIATGQAAPDYFVKDARFDRDDALNLPLVLSDSTQRASLEIVISPNVGQIEGVVSDEKLQPMPGVQAVLIPDKYRDRPELYKATATDQTGHFTMSAVAPGDYRLFAWEALESYGYFDADLIKQVEAQGKVVHVSESSKLQVDVRVIPAAK
jgi:hypothetical protein